MNDAILMAARDLAKRDPSRRKIIFVISDGREQGSTASYKDTLKVLLTQNITVYAVGLEGAAIPIYDKLQRIHLPKTGALLGYSDILPKYVSATGGGTVFNELVAGRHRACLCERHRRRPQPVHPRLFAANGYRRLPRDRCAGARTPGREGLREGRILSAANAALVWNSEPSFDPPVAARVVVGNMGNLRQSLPVWYKNQQ